MLAETVTASGSAKAALVAALCGVLPATGVRVNPWLSKAPMSTVPSTILGSPALVGHDPEGIRLVLPASMAGLPGSRAMVCVGPP